MATTYTSTIEVNVWKEHTCVGCGTVFRYLFKRKKTGQGGSPQKAEANARKAVVRALEHEVDLQPCPGCGLYQPDMIAVRRRRGHWWVFWASVPVLGLLLILAAADVLALGLASWLAAAACAGLALAHLLIDLNNPNRNLEDNQRLGAARAERGDLWVPEGRRPDPGEGTDPGSGRGSGHLFGYLFLALGVVAFAAPEGLRLLRGWPTNPGWHPPVAGPGDEPYVYFADRVTSVKGYWRGTGGALVLNARELGLPSGTTLPLVTKSDNWGNSIRVKSSEKNSRSRLWARVRLPSNADLTGKDLQLKLQLNVEYPAVIPGQVNKWAKRQDTFSQTASLRLAAPAAGATYREGWWLGMLAGSALLLLPGAGLALLAGAFRNKALPTQIVVPKPPAEPEEAADERPGPGEREGAYRPADEDDAQGPGRGRL
jgi:hypothetical protein